MPSRRRRSAGLLWLSTWFVPSLLLAQDYTIAIDSFAPANTDIFVADGDGANPRALFEHPALDYNASLSADGNSVVFTSERAGSADIYRARLDGSELVRLVDHAAFDDQAVLSPDGKSLAFVSSRAGQADVWLRDLETQTSRNLTNAPSGEFCPSWSPDGQWIAFTSDRDPPRTSCVGQAATGPGPFIAPQYTGVFVVRADGAELRRVSSPTQVAGSPVWSADGRTMVFHRERAKRGAAGFVVMPQKSRDPLFALLAVTGPVSFSPDGSRFVYGSTDFSQGQAGSGVLIVANADGTGARALYEAAATDNLTSPAWSPLGDAVVFGVGGFFRRSNTHTARLVSIRPDGTGLRALTNGATNDGMASWSPDGKQLVFRVASGPARGLHILDVATGERRKLETGSERDTFPFWSPRGDWITFTSQRDGDYEIYRIRPDGSGVERLTRFAGSDAHSSISPDGEWIAFATSQQGFKDEALGLVVGARPPPFQSYGEIAVMRIDGSDVRLLTDNSVEEGVPVWVPRRSAVTARPR